MNKFYSFFSLLFTLNVLQAQLTGGTSRGLEVPTTAKPEQTLNTLSDGDVDLFSGLYQHSIPLGTVSTTVGTSFTLTMNYASSGVTSRFQNPDNTIPLGEGWSLNLPYIKFITDTPAKKYSNYVYADKVRQYDYGIANSSIFDSFSSLAGLFTYCREEASSEFMCKIRGISIHLPGIYSGMMVYKYTNATGEAVFVPKTFDKYFELTFRIWGTDLTGYDMDVEAKARMNDGTVYEFRGLQWHLINPPNNVVGGPKSCGNSIPIPVFEGIPIFRISNPHLSERDFIEFNCDYYGNVNHFAEFKQDKLGGRNYNTGSQYVLREIRVSDPEDIENYSQRLKLSYKLYDGYPSIDPTKVKYLDSMYIMKTIFSSGDALRPLYSGTTTTSWLNWNVYRHPATLMGTNTSTGISLLSKWSPTTTSWLHNNPFVHISGGSSSGGLNANTGLKQHRETGLVDANVLNHSYIELNQIPNQLFQSGKMYEINVALSYNSSQQFLKLIDIDLGYSNSGEEHSRGNGMVDYPPYGPGDTRGTVFSTFTRPLKWYHQGIDHILDPKTNQYTLTTKTTSNFFLAPDYGSIGLNAYGNNYILRIGPANSDHYMNAPYSGSLTTYPNGLQLNTSVFTYAKMGWSYTQNLPRKNLKCFKYCEPCGFNFISPNFGLGIPWDQSVGYYWGSGKIDYKFTHVHPNTSNGPTNRPTAIEDVQIKSVQISELEKLPLMLSEVKLIDYRNALLVHDPSGNNDIAYANPVKEDSNVVSIKRFEWSDASTFNAINLSQYNTNSGYHVKKYLLTQLVSQSVNSADNYRETFGYTYSTCANYLNSAERSATNNFNSKFYLLTSVVNNLGLKKTISYLPQSRFRILRNDVVQFNFIVSAITKEPLLASGSVGEKKITHYSFENYVSGGLCFDTRKDGFGNVTVLHPVIPGTTSRKRTEYVFDVCSGCSLAMRCMPSNFNQWLTFGKLKEINEYNENSTLTLVKRVVYEYNKKLAYKNGLRRVYPTTVLCAYADGGDFASIVNGKYAFRNLQSDANLGVPIEFDNQNHAYFTAKSKATTTEFYKNKAGNDVSTDFVELYEYYDADSNGVYHNEGQRIIDGINATSNYYIEPSWNLYKTVSYSTANPSFKTMKEIFYMYQFMNFDICSGLDIFMGPGHLAGYETQVVKKLLTHYHVKDLITEIRTSHITETPTGAVDTVRKSKYFKYELQYIDNFRINERLPDEETIYDTTFKKIKCREYTEEERAKHIRDSIDGEKAKIIANYQRRDCQVYGQPPFKPYKDNYDEYERQWDTTRIYTEIVREGCYIRSYDRVLGLWVTCPCPPSNPKLRDILWDYIDPRKVNFIGLKDLINLKDFIEKPKLGGISIDPLKLIGTAGVLGGFIPIANHQEVYQMTEMEKQLYRPAYQPDKLEEREAALNRTDIRYRINAFDESAVKSVILDTDTKEIGCLIVPGLNKVLTINFDKLADYQTASDQANTLPLSEAQYAAALEGLNYLSSRYSPENIVPLEVFERSVDPMEVNSLLQQDNGEGDPPPRYYPPEYNMRILFKSEHEKVDDLVLSSSGQWMSSPESRMDIGRFTDINTLSFHIPFHNIKQKEIMLRNTALQTEIEMDAKGMLTRYYYGDYSFKKVCNNKGCPDIHGNIIPNNDCYRALSTNSLFLPIRITTGFYQSDSIGIHLFYNKNATLSHTISDQGARVDYRYDGFNRLIETKKDGKVLARYRYNMWDRGNYTGIDAITNQNFIETRTWLNKTNAEGTISRSFIDPFGRKMGSILATSSDLNSSPSSYTGAIMSGYQQLDWEEKPLKEYKPFQVTGGLQLYRNTTSSGAPLEHRQYTYDFKSQPLRSYDFGISAASAQYAESTTTLEDAGYFENELQPNSLEKAILGWDAGHSYLRTESRDPDGKIHVSYSHVNGKKMADHIPMGGANLNINTLYGYDRKWDLKKVIDPEKKETTYLTNLQGLVFEKVTPDQGMSLYFYDEAGSLAAMQDRNLWQEGILRMRVFTYDHFGRMLMQLVGNLNAMALCPNCGYNTPITGGGGGQQNYRPANPMAYFLYPGAKLYDISYPPSNTNPVLPNSYGRSYHWLPNRNVLNEQGEGKFTIFDSLINIKVEKHFAYNDLDTKYIDEVERSPNHNKLYKTKLLEIKSLLGGDVQTEVGDSARRQKSLGKLSTATSYDYMGNVNEIVTTTYNSDELPEHEYHHARFRTYTTGSNPMVHQFLLRYSDYNLAGKPAKVELFKQNGGGNTPVYATLSTYNALGHLTQLQYKVGPSATVYNTLADYSYHRPSGKLTQVQSYMPGISLTTNYSYDIRERLTEIDNSMFQEKLYYDNNFPTTGLTGTGVANYNGNINAVYTQHKGCGGLLPLTYKYHYDAANRLTRAFSDARNIPSGAAYGSQDFFYQRNGSMHRFVTEELNGGGMSTTPRNHEYTYLSGTNQVDKITPTAGGTLTAPWNTNNRGFTYDKNGNVVTDPYRDMTLSYDRANLPYRATKSTSTSTSQLFGYNTADARIFKGNDAKAYYYLGGSVYDMTLDQWEHYPGGLAVHKNGSLNLVIKDHLTNTRAVVRPNTDGCTGPTYEAQYDYYPYGKVLRKIENPRSRFQSTDHETDLETGYNNRNARWYDGESFNFLQVDPLSAIYPSLTPYNYVERNPISLIDPTGMYSEGESQDQYEAAKERGLNPSTPYQMDNGEFAFNTGYKDANGNYVVNTWHKEDFKPAIAERIETGLRSVYSGAPSWLTNMSNEGSWAHNSLKVVGDFAMGMNPVANARSLFSGNNWQGEQQHRGWAMFGLVTLGLGGEVNAATKTGGRVFWSGRETARNAAEAFAKANGMTTLEMTHKGRLLEMITPILPTKVSSYLWTKLSSHFAKGANGNVHVFHNATDGIRINSVWAQTEYGILKDRVNLIYHNVFR